MDRKEKILSYMCSKEYIPLKFAELMTVLDVPAEDEEELRDILTELCIEGKIYMTKKGRYMSIEGENSTVVGKLVCNAKGFFGFVICDDENESDIFISGDDMGDAINGDRVIVHIDDNDNAKGHRQGHITKVLERGNKVIVGVIYKEKERYFYVRPDNRKIYSKIIIAQSDAMTAQMGDRVAVQITRYSDKKKIFGEVISVLGQQESLKSCIEGIILGNDIKQEFDKETLNEADKIPQTVTESQFAGREDLRDMIIFTIDGDDARDFDDAVSLTLKDNGNYYLGVHIADVSEYVKEDTALENEAYKRGTSVYLADRVIPMLPTSLSNGICSLNPQVDRLTLSVFMEITGDGNVVSHKLCKSVICSKERMTYNNVNKMLEDGDEELCERYKHILPTLKLMEDLAQILKNKRTLRGAIQFDFPESHIVVNENGEPIEIEKEVRGTSNKMIEEFMLSANETIAEYAFWSEIPFVYRNHEAPTLDKIMTFNEFILHFGLSFKGKIDRDTPIHPKALQQILDTVKDTPQERIVASTMLHSLMKAKYSEENLGHFGLAAKYYCHFTSPIRRYPDLQIHRIIKECLHGGMSEKRKLHYDKILPDVAEQASATERRADEAERDTDKLKMVQYMSAHIGEYFDGVISGVTNWGIYVELPNTIEGMVSVNNMRGYYVFDENHYEMFNETTHQTYKLGQKVRVVVVDTNEISRTIDFMFAQDYEE